MSADSLRPLGEWLQQRREELDLSLEQAEEATRIRLSYLQALESEDMDALPNPVVARGFLRNYAAYLDLDPQEAASRYSERIAPPEPESLSVEGPTPFDTEPFRPVSLHDMPASRGRRLWIVGLAAILVIALGILGWWGYPRISEWLDQQEFSVFRREATAEATKERLPTGTYTPTATVPATRAAEVTPTEATPTLEVTFTPTLSPSPSPMPSPSVYTGIFLELVFTDTSWIQVTVDDVRQFQGELDAETYRSWYGEERIELRIGNAGAVQITVNGEFLGTLGPPGEVVDRVFEKVGEGVSAATVTPAPTTDLTAEPATSTPPPTVLPTSTLTPTLTITPTATLTPTASP